MKKALILIVLLLAVFVGGILLFDENTHAQEAKPFIAVTNFPLYEICTKLLDNEIEVKKLIPFGVEVHAYRPSVKTMTQMSKAELFLYSGLGMEPWITKKFDNIFDMSTFVELNDVKEEHHGHHHGEQDPHYWLDIENMIRMTSVLSRKFQKRFPSYKVMIENNADVYINELNELKAQYKKSLKSCQRKEIVVNHNAFGYLAKTYDFHSHSLTGLSPDEQVSAKKMKEITDLVNEEDIKVIFFESFVSDKIAKSISKETGAQARSLQPLANVTQDEAGKGYILLMQENLVKLSDAMECE